MNNSDTHLFLEKLGLTEYEAKTLGTLFALREAEAPSISRTAQVPKTRVYDVLEKLMQRNLIIEIKGRPKIYRAVEPKKAIDVLLTAKKNQFGELEKEALEVKENYYESEGKDETGEKIMKVKDRRDFEKILGQELLKANKSIQGLTEIQDDHDAIHEALKRAKQKNVSIRLLNTIQSKRLKESSEVRHMNHGINAFIIDGKKVILAISDFKKQKLDYHFTILNDHVPLATAFLSYFEKHWKDAKVY